MRGPSSPPKPGPSSLSVAVAIGEIGIALALLAHLLKHLLGGYG